MLENNNIIQTINTLQKELWQTAESHGFHAVQRINDKSWAQAVIKLALIVSEVGEAVEALRKDDQSNFAEELADIFIRLLDLAEECNIKLGDEVIKKAEKNIERPPLHNKLF